LGGTGRSGPEWSYRLNADFEDHAEHEYALLVTEHPEWEDEPYDGARRATGVLRPARRHIAAVVIA
jgi:hypothetical protein